MASQQEGSMLSAGDSMSNLLSVESNGVDEGIITEIARLRELMRMEDESRLGGGGTKRGGGGGDGGDSGDEEGGADGEKSTVDRVSMAETTLEEKRFIPNEFDNVRVERKVYRMKCDKLCISPVSAVIKHVGGTSLDLKYYPVGPLGAQAIAAPLLINTTIMTLNLKGTGIEDTGFRSIVSTLSENTFLQELNVAQCNLSVKSAQEIGRLLIYNTTITRLDLSGNSLGDSSAEALAAGIKQMRHISDLNLSDVGLGSRGGELLGPAIGHNDTLSILDLSWNHISRQGATAIVKGIQNNVRLHQVDLAWNGFGHDGAVAIGNLLKSGSSLMYLNLSHNRIGDSAVVALATGIEKNEDLTYFDLSHNYLTGMGVMAVLKGIERSATGQMELVNMEGIVVDDQHPDFKKKIEDLKQKCPNLDVRFDHYPISRVKADLLLLFFKKLEEKQLTLTELFSSRDDWELPQSEALGKEEFIVLIQEAGIDIPKDTLYKIGSQLDIQDKNTVNLSVLNTRYEEFSNGEYEPNQDYPVPESEPSERQGSSKKPPQFLPPAGLSNPAAARTVDNRTDSARTKRTSFSAVAGT